MKKLIVFVIFLVAIVMLLGGCGSVGHAATGPVVSRSFDVGDFTGVSIGGSREVIFRQRENSLVTIEMQESLFDILQVYVRGGTLHVYTDGSVFNPGRQRVYIYAPQLEAASISGSARATDWDIISVENFSLTASGSTNVSIALDVQSLNVTASGSSSVELSGSADTVDITRSGSGTISAFGLQTRNATVGRSGSSNVNISVSDNLDATSSGSGRLQYRGNPSVAQTVSGSSSVVRVD